LKLSAAKSLLAATLYSAAVALAQQPAATTPEQKLAKLAGKATGKVVYQGATVIADGNAGKGIALTGMAIVVEGEIIKAIVPAAKLDPAMAEGAEKVDAQGLFVIPGLVDSHVHYATQPARAIAEAELKRDIYGGLTGVRDMAGDARALADLSRAALVNEIPSPDIYYSSLVAGPSFFQDPRTLVAALGMRAGQVPWLYAVSEETNLPLAIAQARGTGATGLKIYANLPGSLVRGLIAEAKRQDFPVWTHQQVYPATPYDSLGATAVSHVCMIARFVLEPGKSSYGHSNEPSYTGMTAANAGIAQYIAALAKSGTIMDATLSVYAPSKPGPDGKVPESKRCPITLAGDITRAMHEAGIAIDAGTDVDAGPDNPWPALYAELEYLVRYAGFTPYQAIDAATRTAAAVTGKQKEFGTLEAGKFANMVFLRQDPTQDIANLRSVVFTVKRGNRYARSDYHHQPIPEQP
jgi:Amidohydrolase family